MSRLLLVICVVVCAWEQTALAHDFDVQRRAILQVGPDRADLLLVYEVPAGNPADLLRTLYDANHDGVLAPEERKALAAKLSRDALTGLGLSRNGTDLASRSVEWKLDVSPGGVQGFVLALLVELPGGPGRYEVALDGSASTPAMQLDVEAGEGMRLVRAVSAPDADGIRVTGLVLAVGDLLWFEVATDPPADE